MREIFLRLLGFGRPVLWNVDGLGAHRSEQLQGKGKAEPALVDPVDKHLDVNRHPLGLEPAGEVLVGDVFLLTKVLDKRLGTRPRLGS